MAVTSLLRLSAAALGFLDFRGVEQCCDDGSRADPDRDAGLYQLGPPFIVTLTVVAHSNLAKSIVLRPYAEAAVFGSVKGLPCAAA